MRYSKRIKADEETTNATIVTAEFANEEAEMTNSEELRDNGVEEVNDAYDFTVDTSSDGIGASAGISSGGWASLGSELSYMKFPEGVVSDDGEDGLWCYCIDISTDTKDGHKYSMTTLDAAGYYEKEAADKIRSILINSYPNISIDDLKKIYELSELTEEEAFMATQWILWYYSNPDGLVDAGGGHYYTANIYKPSDYPKETVTMWREDGQGSDIREQSSNVVKLAKALDALSPAEPEASDEPTEPIEIEDTATLDKEASPKTGDDSDVLPFAIAMITVPVYAAAVFDRRNRV